MPIDEWTRTLADSRTVLYTSNIEEGTGGMITARVGDITRALAVQTPMTRQEVEAAFSDLQGAPGAKEG
jgi:hypothetical protein